MKKLFLLLLVSGIVLGTSSIHAQRTSFVVGGKIGLSIGSAGGQSEAGLQIGPMFETIFNKNIAIGTELLINTQAGTIVAWNDYFKYYFTIKGSKIKPYADIGISLWFPTGGPYFGIIFGGGADIPVAKNLSVPIDLQLGPILGVENTTPFYIAITGGIKYYL